MHSHQCRYCNESYICAESIQCFNRYKPITCDKCFWSHESIWILLVFILGVIAIGLTYLLVNLTQNLKG